MDTYPIAGGGAVYRFDTGTFNWYVIEQGGRLTLVDAGFPGHYAIFRKGIGALGRTLADLDAIVLTHAHADHMGFMEHLRRETGIPVFAHADDARQAQRRLQLPWFGLLTNAWHPYMAQILTHATINGVFTMPGIAEVQTIKDGQILDVPGQPVVIHVPGHTNGQIALYVPGAKVLIAGDALVTRNLITGRLGEPGVVVPILSDDYLLSLKSLAKLKDLGRVTLVSGHGTPWVGEAATAVEVAKSHGQFVLDRR